MTRRWQTHLFFALLSISVTNAFGAWQTTCRRRGEPSATLHSFKKQLASELMESADFSASASKTSTRVKVDPGSQESACQCGHSFVKRSETRNNPLCSVCRKLRSTWFCECGVPVCHPKDAKQACFVAHLLKAINTATWAAMRGDIKIEPQDD